MISKNQWKDIPQEIRLKLVDIFQIPRSGQSIVDGGVIKEDGRNENDLALGLTVDKMRDYLEIGLSPASLDYDHLLKAVLAKVQGLPVDLPAELNEPSAEADKTIKPIKEKPVKPIKK